jgi:hypothetical protein
MVFFGQIYRKFLSCCPIRALKYFSNLRSHQEVAERTFKLGRDLFLIPQCVYSQQTNRERQAKSFIITHPHYSKMTH